MLTKKMQLDQEVAVQLGMSLKKVRLITKVFLDVAIRELAEMNEVRLEGLGDLKVVARRGGAVTITPIVKGGAEGQTQRRRGPAVSWEGGTKYYVSFKKGRPLTEAIKARFGRQMDKVMEKYGVDEAGTEQEKRAAAGCPRCGSKVEKHGNVLACPRCGTEPFETKK